MVSLYNYNSWLRFAVHLLWCKIKYIVFKLREFNGKDAEYKDTARITCNFVLIITWQSKKTMDATRTV